MTDATFGGALTRLWSNASKPLLEGIIASAPSVFAKYGITTPLLAAHVMAQISHECGAGHDVVENLNYSPQGIVRTWPSRFPSLAEAIPFAHKPQDLANKVYNGRMGNKPGSNMGWTFRGRGGCNTTGHDAYYALAQKMALDLLNNPDLVNRPDLFLECAVVDFIMCGCVPFAKNDDLRGVTHHLNGGFIGLAEREVWLKQWKSALLPVHGQEALFPAPAPRTEGELRFGDSGFEVKGLQGGLKAKNYACGIDDGDYLEGTRGAVAKFQLDHGLPATGVADSATKEVLAKSPGAPIAEARAAATVQDLREAGSRTVAGADRVSFIGKLKTWLGLGIGGGAVAGPCRHAGSRFRAGRARQGAAGRRRTRSAQGPRRAAAGLAEAAADPSGGAAGGRRDRDRRHPAGARGAPHQAGAARRSPLRREYGALTMLTAIAGAIALIPGGGAAYGAAASAFGYLLRCGTCLKVLGVLALMGWTAFHVHRADVARCDARIEDDHNKAEVARQHRDASIAEDLGKKYAPEINRLATLNKTLQKKVDDAKNRKPVAAVGRCKLGDAAGLLQP